MRSSRLPFSRRGRLVDTRRRSVNRVRPLGRLRWPMVAIGIAVGRGNTLRHEAGKVGKAGE